MFCIERIRFKRSIFNEKKVNIHTIVYIKECTMMLLTLLQSGYVLKYQELKQIKRINPNAHVL